MTDARASRQWSETKYVLGPDGGLRASRDPREVATSSRLMADRIGRFYSAALPKYASGHVLDLGCGKAPLLGLYRQYSKSETLVDWGNSMHENPHLDAIADLNEPLELESEKFDTVLLSDVLEHIKRPSQLMSEIFRVMAPGGALIMNTPFMYWLHEQPHDYYRYTEHALTELITSAGLEVVELAPLGGALEVLVDMTSKVASMHVRRGGRSMAIAIQLLGGAVAESSFGTRVAQRTAPTFPLGYALVARKPAISARVG
jgi:SAM-dependent methyltransferase